MAVVVHLGGRSGRSFGYREHPRIGIELASALKGDGAGLSFFGEGQ